MKKQIVEKGSEKRETLGMLTSPSSSLIRAHIMWTHVLMKPPDHLSGRPTRTLPLSMNSEHTPSQWWWWWWVVDVRCWWGGLQISKGGIRMQDAAHGVPGNSNKNVIESNPLKRWLNGRGASSQSSVKIHERSENVCVCVCVCVRACVWLKCYEPHEERPVLAYSQDNLYICV